MDEPRSLKDEILFRMEREDNKLALATSIIDNAKKGDKSSMALVGKLLDEKASNDLEKLFPLTDDQFRTVLILAVERMKNAQRSI